MRFEAIQACPAFLNLAFINADNASVKSASSHTINGAFPPSSRDNYKHALFLNDKTIFE
jgi:hypothetical protein